jgi:hypothetical protein
MDKPDDDYVTHARAWWREAKKEHPIATTIAEVMPVTGQLAAVADYADAMDAGNTGDGIKAAVSFIPGVKLAKAATRIAPASLRVGMNAAEKALAPITRHAQQINRAGNALEVGDAAADYAQAWNNDAH